MEVKKVLGIVFSIVFIVAFGFVLTWAIINQNKVKDAMKGTELYTYEDLINAKQDGYDDALADKDEYEKLINSYRDTITTQTDQISQLNSQITILTNQNKDSETLIVNLRTQKQSLETEVENLTNINNDNASTIETLNNEILALEKEIIVLEKNADDNASEIESKTKQIETLQSVNAQLQRTNELNANTITSLNNQIVDLNKQISDYSLAISNNSGTINTLNAKIADLEKSVAYYEQYIANLENGEQVVATFEFDGSVYNVQILNKGDVASVTTPASTEYVIFNGWTVDGEIVDLSTYTINTNTKFVADVTYKYEVVFNVDSIEYDSQFVEFEDFATLPENPTKDGYEFDGWTINGVDVVNVSEYQIISNMAFVAKFTQLHEVVFMVENEVFETQNVRNGSYATLPTEPVKEGYRFDGWMLNTALIDISTSVITSATVYEAKFTELKGLFDTETGEMLYSFDELIENGYITVNSYNNWMTATTSASELSGDLTVPEYIAGFSSMSNIGGLRSVTIPNSVTLLNGFKGCKSLEAVYFEEGTQVSSIGYDAFQNCSSLKEIEIPSTVVSVDCYSFSGCPDELFTIYQGCKYIGNSENPYMILFKYVNTSVITHTTPVSTKLIAPWAFMNNSTIQKVDISSNVIYLGYGAFRQCTALTNVTIRTGMNISEIGANVFLGCSALTSIFIPQSVTKIGNEAFDGCKSLTSVIIEEGSQLLSIGEDAFYGCSKLTTINLPSTLTSIGAEAFRYCYVLQTIWISKTVTTIGEYAFQTAGRDTSYGTIKIYCETSSKPSGWNSKWNYFASDAGDCKTYWNYSYQQYLSAIGA